MKTFDLKRAPQPLSVLLGGCCRGFCARGHGILLVDRDVNHCATKDRKQESVRLRTGNVAVELDSEVGILLILLYHLDCITATENVSN